MNSPFPPPPQPKLPGKLKTHALFSWLLSLFTGQPRTFEDDYANLDLRVNFLLTLICMMATVFYGVVYVSAGFWVAAIINGVALAAYVLPLIWVMRRQVNWARFALPVVYVIHIGVHSVVTFPPDSLFHAYLLPLPVFFFLHLNRSPVYWRLLLSLMVLAFYVLVEFRWWPTGTVAGWPLYPMEASIQQVFRLTTTLFLLSGMLLFLTVFANGAAHVTRQLRLLASHDSLTGLINRRSVLDRLQHHLSLSDRYGDPLSLVLIDLDFFKQVNDRHGHHAGDEVLRSVGQLLREQTRKSDLCARFGGEEFLVVCPLTTAAQACQLAEKLGQKLRELEIQIGQGRITRVTGSFGVAEKGHASVSAHVFLQKADRALYAAKRAGRDRICLYDPARERTSIPQEP